jgi:hypothetical protein
MWAAMATAISASVKARLPGGRPRRIGWSGATERRFGGWGAAFARFRADALVRLIFSAVSGNLIPLRPA